MAKKKAPKKSKTFNRLSVVSMIHWTTRATKNFSDNLGVSIRSMKVTAETFDECARISLAKDLMLGEADSSIQKDFDAIVAANKENFMRANPGYEYRVGGRIPVST